VLGNCTPSVLHTLNMPSCLCCNAHTCSAPCHTPAPYLLKWTCVSRVALMLYSKPAKRADNSVLQQHWLANIMHSLLLVLCMRHRQRVFPYECRRCSQKYESNPEQCIKPAGSPQTEVVVKKWAAHSTLKPTLAMQPPRLVPTLSPTPPPMHKRRAATISSSCWPVDVCGAAHSTAAVQKRRPEHDEETGCLLSSSSAANCCPGTLHTPSIHNPACDTGHSCYVVHSTCHTLLCGGCCTSLAYRRAICHASSMLLDRSMDTEQPTALPLLSHAAN
jgi:hypothetical protein